MQPPPRCEAQGTHEAGALEPVGLCTHPAALEPLCTHHMMHPPVPPSAAPQQGTQKPCQGFCALAWHTANKALSFVSRITKYPKLLRTHEDHWAQLRAPHRTTQNQPCVWEHSPNASWAQCCGHRPVDPVPAPNHLLSEEHRIMKKVLQLSSWFSVSWA